MEDLFGMEDNGAAFSEDRKYRYCLIMEQNSNIKSRVLKTEPINWRELQFIQNANFKELE